MLLQDGQYDAVVIAASPYLRKEERLSVAFKLKVDGKDIICNQHIELNDGSLGEKTIQNLKDCFKHWNGSVDELFNEQNFINEQVSVTIENVPGTKNPEQMFSQVKWMNPLGSSGGGMKMPEQADKKTVAAKYGARFRALGGGTKPAAAKPEEKTAPENKPFDKPAGPPAKAKAKAPPAAKGPGQMECWNMLQKSMGDRPRKEMEDKWAAILDEVAPGVEYDDVTPAQWVTIMDACDNIVV